MDKDKLPKWAQDYINEIEGERAVAVAALNGYLEEQKPAPFYTYDYLCLGERDDHAPTFKKRFIQARRIHVEHAGIHLSILLRDNHIDLQWDEVERDTRDVAFIPSSYQCARLISKNNMRG